MPVDGVAQSLGKHGTKLALGVFERGQDVAYEGVVGIGVGHGGVSEHKPCQALNAWILDETPGGEVAVATPDRACLGR